MAKAGGWGCQIQPACCPVYGCTHVTVARAAGDRLVVRNHEIFRYDAVYSCRGVRCRCIDTRPISSKPSRARIMRNVREKMREFSSKKHFDEDIPVDVEEVLDVAAHLDMREFDVFHLAYSWWHGQDSTDANIEPFFVKYMFHSVVPPWVRQFTRMALRLKAEGRLNAGDFGIHRLPATAAMVSKGIRYAIILVMTLATLIILAQLSVDLYSRCMFPPCY